MSRHSSMHGSDYVTSTEEGESSCPIKKSLNMLNYQMDGCQFERLKIHVFVIFGASGNVASKKIYPTLWNLFRSNFLPQKTYIIGFCRTNLSVSQIQERTRNQTRVENNNLYKKYSAFHVTCRGNYDNIEDIQRLNNIIVQKEGGAPSNRIFILAIPPTVIQPTLLNIKNFCIPSQSSVRIILGKPFGNDLESSDEISNNIKELFNETHIFRVDHEINQEMLQNFLTLRFTNDFISATFNRHYIAAVLITHKEDVGVYGRGGHYDKFGIIKDTMLTHLLQILTFIAMEKPMSCLPEDIRDEKVRLLKMIKPVRLRETILGQYRGKPKGLGEQIYGYLDDLTVPKNSITPTYATMVLQIGNERWEGVPFILVGGKALDEEKTEVRVQYSTVAGDIFENNYARNELIVTMKPTPSIFMKILMKSPGINFVVENSVIDLTSPTPESTGKISTFERIILDVVSGTHLHCIRTDELHEAWRIFTPLLKQIEEDRIKPQPYVYGSHGPREAEIFLREQNFVL